MKSKIIKKRATEIIERKEKYNLEDKKYILTKEDRDEVISLIAKRSTIGARTFLLQLPELKNKEKILDEWFAKNFGMEISEKNKVQDIECKIEDFLELKKKLSK